MDNDTPEHGRTLLTSTVPTCILPLPPGPKSWPIVGNLFDMPTTRPWETFCEWRKTYNSDIIFLDMPLQPILVVGSAKAALELLEKRSNLWSDRISLIIIELMSLNISTAFMPYGSRWRAHRRMFHQEFHPGVVEKYRPIQLDYARRFCSWVSKSPADTRKIVRQMVTGIIFFVAYGKRVSGMDDEAVITAQIASEGLSEGAMPGFSWLNYFPLARHIPSWVPGTYSKKLADKYLPYVQAMRDKPYDEVKAAFQMGVAPPSLAASLMERNRAKYGGTNEEGVHDETARNVAVLAYGAGADTTTSSCESFLLAIALFPEVQMKAQSELDRVIGPHRLPEFDDLENLPYVRAVVMETIRWIPVSPSGIPHVVVADDLYDGYHIPKGTAAIPNIWGMLHEPKDYPDPEKFWPDRFIGADGNIDPTVRDPSTIAFGFGRRESVQQQYSGHLYRDRLACL
ncbi:hypothetical protein EUX98_g4360 [Antrodiella citrinella]|uniref:Cytochrome P450 n=1 Tax=Antrodiella citrinella TaxID=2447956 RepID=A0A4S4MU46_9APHY|nr:hypothetical protein EUX98_g4360 [Antrodiella citrinella]